LCFAHCVPLTADSLPNDIATLKAMVIAAESKAQNAEAEAKACALLIEQMKFTIAKLRHEQYGQSSERGAILEQLELRLADLEEDASEAEAQAQLAAAAAAAAAAKVKVEGFERKRPARRPLPDHLPRERLVHPAPTACSCCGSTALRKIGEDVTETLEHVPSSWKVIQHVREKFSCRSCETIAQTPAPSHPIARGRVGPFLLAHILFANTVCICRSIDRARPMRERAWNSTSRRLPIGWALRQRH
jgi:transposase